MRPVASLPGKAASLWIDTTPETSFPSLAGDASVDVAVIGGGITGITAATLLKRTGRTVALVEWKRVIRGVTGYTTAKVTSSHSVIYKDLVERFDEETARAYGASQEAALAQIARFVEDEAIDCEFERTSNFLYAETDDDLETVQQEAETAARLGLPASFVRETPLPFPVAGAARFENQAAFHPRRYLLHFANQIPGEGSHVFEETRALRVREGDVCRVETDRGVVSARAVVVATSLPFLDRGFFFARAHPYRSYVVCPRVDEANAPPGMYVSTERPSHTIRRSAYPGGTVLVIAGEGHKAGQAGDSAERYRRLDEWARSRFAVEATEYRWSTQDYYSVDKLPLIGRLTRRSRNVYVATGYRAWGMTNGTLAAMILSDLIAGRENEWAEIYDAKRIEPRAAAAMFVKENLSAAKHLLLRRSVTTRKADEAAEIPAGGGAVVRVRGRNVAVYRDEDGALHAISPVCTHLGCVVGWNPAEKSWDCPCHGSRYSREGLVIQGPAVRDLEPRGDALEHLRES
jgi:glycine/D-amino acid oxidase-like deaminating enzyme/nitrite reductase/ring-hydroxylating ferredoxin subunit